LAAALVALLKTLPARDQPFACRVNGVH